jgi:hypothetical protein
MIGMKAPRTLFIADMFAESRRDAYSRYPGGAEQTDQAIIEAAPWPVEPIASQEATPAILERFDLHVVGNLQELRPELIETFARLGRHVLFEHDLRICCRRGNFLTAKDPFHRWLGWCVCRHRRLRPVLASSMGMIFLTHLQLSAYRRNPFFRPPAVQVLGSSVFGRDFFDRGARIRSEPDRHERRGFCVAYSANRIKGYAAALAYCRKRGIEPQVIRNLSPTEVLDMLQGCRGFVFLPAQLEPAGRMPVEARFLGCEVVTNRHVGVAGESWWHLPDDQALEVVRDAGPRFWRMIIQLITLKASGSGQAEETSQLLQEPAR